MHGAGLVRSIFRFGLASAIAASNYLAIAEDRCGG